jgi:hypothetical protein
LSRFLATEGHGISLNEIMQIGPGSPDAMVKTRSLGFSPGISNSESKNR